MITRDQVLIMPHGLGLDGKDRHNSAVWHRAFTTGPRLSRWVGWFELEVWQQSKARPEIRFKIRAGHMERHGLAESWEAAMSGAEDTLRALLAEWSTKI